MKSAVARSYMTLRVQRVAAQILTVGLSLGLLKDEADFAYSARRNRFKEISEVLHGGAQGSVSRHHKTMINRSLEPITNVYVYMDWEIEHF